MLKPRANAISRLLTNGGFTRASAANTGFTVFQDGDTCKVYAVGHTIALDGMVRRLELCDYAATIENDDKENARFVRVTARP